MKAKRENENQRKRIRKEINLLETKFGKWNQLYKKMKRKLQNKGSVRAARDRTCLGKKKTGIPQFNDFGLDRLRAGGR